MTMHGITESIAILRKETYKMMRNPHFWIICSMMIAFSILYYTGFPTIKEKAAWLRDFRTFEYIHNIQGSLLYLPFIYAAVAFGWIGITTIWVISLTIMIPRVVYFAHNVSSLSNNISFLTVPVMLILLIVIISKWLKSERKMYLEREAQRQVFMSQVLKAHEDERKHIAQELHDDTIQTLLALNNRIQSLLNKESNSLSVKIAQQLDSFSNSIYAVTEDLRKVCVNLRPSILDDIGFLEAIRSLVDNLNNGAIKTRLVVNGENRKLSSETGVIVYRFIQEALNNVSRHSEASEVIVNLDFGTEATKIRVQDNGKGFILPKQLGELTTNHKLGIVGMQERAKLLGGSFNIYSQPGSGTSVYLEF